MLRFLARRLLAEAEAKLARQRKVLREMQADELGRPPAIAAPAASFLPNAAP